MIKSKGERSEFIITLAFLNSLVIIFSETKLVFVCYQQIPKRRHYDTSYLLRYKAESY